MKKIWQFYFSKSLPLVYSYTTKSFGHMIRVDENYERFPSSRYFPEATNTGKPRNFAPLKRFQANTINTFL
jgi:hypothetical protein